MSHRFDQITAEQLRAAGSLKWTAHPQALAAWVAEMDFGLAPPVVAALHRAVDAGLTAYLPPALLDELRVACARWQQDAHGWMVQPERVQPVADVLVALQIVVEHFSPAGSSVILPTPAYMPFVRVPQQWGKTVLQVPMVEDSGHMVIDLDGLDRAFAAGGGLLVLTNPHNPTGGVMTREELLAVSEVVDRHGGRVFADEIHAPIVFAGHTHVPYASISATTAQHTVTATSASKGWNLPGLKCAQLLLTNDQDLAVWAPIEQYLSHGAGTPGVLTNAVAYAQGGPWLAEVMDYLQGNRQVFAELIDRLVPGAVHRPPEGTYLAWVDLRRAGPDGRGLGDRPAAALLREAGVVVTDGAECGDAGRGFIRFNLAMPQPLLVQAVHQLAAAIEQRANG